LLLLTLVVVGESSLATLRRALDQKRQGELVINLTPKAEYGPDRRVKYSVASVGTDVLVKADDCDTVYNGRSWIQPTTVAFTVTAPHLPSVGEPAAVKATDKPAIVVITSSKPKWFFTNLINNNLRSTTAKQWALWYSPFRPQREGRSIFVIVHQSEFDNYKKGMEDALATIAAKATELARYSAVVNNVRIVGCSIATGTDATPLQNIGFGLNRFCGMAYMNKIGQKRFWMVDDNLVTISGVKDELEVYETAAATDNLAVLGFKAPSGDALASRALANTELNLNTMEAIMDSGTTKPAATNPTLAAGADNHWLEQLYLFDNTKLSTVDNSFRSFSPRFVLSKEDLTFSADLLKKHIAYKLVDNGLLFKVAPYPEDFVALARDFTYIKGKIVADNQIVKYGPAFAKSGKWTAFAKDNPKIGAINLQGLDEIGGAANAELPGERWEQTIIKTQEIVMFKCAQKGITTDTFDFDSFFNFPKTVLAPAVTMVRLAA